MYNMHPHIRIKVPAWQHQEVIIASCKSAICHYRCQWDRNGVHDTIDEFLILQQVHINVSTERDHGMGYSQWGQ